MTLKNSFKRLKPLLVFTLRDHRGLQIIGMLKRLCLLRSFSLVLHNALDTIGFKFLNVSHVEERGDYLLLFESPGVHHICHFNFVLALALNLNFSLVLYRNIVVEQA